MFWKKLKKPIYLVPASLVLLILISIAGFFVYFNNKIYPSIYINSVSVGGKSVQQAQKTIQSTTNVPEKLTFTYKAEDGDQHFEIPLSSISVQYDFAATASAAYEIGRKGNLKHKIKGTFETILFGQNIPLEFSLEEEELNTLLGTIASQITTDPIYPSASIVNGSVVVNPGKAGTKLDTDAIKSEVYSRLSQTTDQPIDLKTTMVDESLTDEQVASYQERAAKFIGKSIAVKYENDSLEFDANNLLITIDPEGGYLNSALDELVAVAAEKFNREPQNPTFVFEEGKVQEFSAAKKGLATKKDVLTQLLLDDISKLENSDTGNLTVSLPVVTTDPEVQTSEVNDLGIKELIGRGTSLYRGSIASRVYNINLAASRLNGTLISSGETFSFNEALGDVSKFTGFKEAYVIKDGKTVLGDGGGVCQVSTTFFRAAMNAGLPIVERRAHSYRVGYYEQDAGPGLDATVYAPTTDLKVLNDTPAHILVQAYADTTNYTLTFEFYGTSDGRVSTVTKPVILSSTPPGEDVYVDDPTLPEGTTKQIEYKAWGAQTKFNYSVEKGGETIYSKDFYSNYRPWQAVFLRGTAPVQQ